MQFTEADLFAVFEAWNNAAWPLQFIAYGLGLIAVGLLLRPSKRSTTTTLIILAAMWLVNGIGFHWSYYTAVTPAAWVFGAAFVIEGLLLAATPFVAPTFRIGPRKDAATLVALALILYAMVFYPLLGMLFGQSYPATPTFGLIPCPTTIFTLGLLLLGSWGMAKWLLIIPCLWGVVGGSAAILFGVPQDYGLILAMLLAVGSVIGHWFGLRLVRHEIQERA
ncbi:DUF6064 family protein [uncultured Cohaesibacter sp.]|uniref:DUF6064 family protein n=1 Tax=uncultured Cohaesibacter sp. TaxID=1002546 RepID=UPI00292EDCF3|nr:DUF6064 family protein [uncultured Cohaesibacter sp.]